MKKVLALFLGLIGALVLACVAVIAVPSLDDLLDDSPLAGIVEAVDDLKSGFENAVGGAKDGAVNAAIDASGIKTRVQSALDSNVDRIAEATGIPADTVQSAVSAINVEDWQATTLPDSAAETGSFSGSAMGGDGTVTLYDDPGYVTVEAYGQEITFAIPPDAQDYLAYASMLG